MTKLNLFFFVAMILAISNVKAEIKIGVVDVKQLLNGYEKYQAFEETLQKKAKKYKSNIDKLELEMKQIVYEIKNLKKGSPDRQQFYGQYRQKAKALQLAKFELKLELDSLNELLSGRIYDDILQGIRDFASQNGYHLVFKSSNLKRSNKNINELHRKLEMASVLYFDKSLDITKKVLLLLNKQYRRKQVKDKEKEK